MDEINFVAIVGDPNKCAKHGDLVLSQFYGNNLVCVDCIAESRAKMAGELQDYLKDEIEFMVLQFFNGNKEKQKKWMETKNPALGNASANDMLKAGRHEKLKMFVRYQVEENWRE